MKNTLTTGKTIMLSVILFVIGYAITYVGFRNMTSQPHISEEQMELFFLYCSPNVLLMTMAIFLIVQKIQIRSPYIISILSNITKCGFRHLYDTLFHCRNWLLNHRKNQYPNSSPDSYHWHSCIYFILGNCSLNLQIYAEIC